MDYANLNFHLFTFIPQLINLLILAFIIYLIVRIFVKENDWFHRKQKNEEEILRRLDELIKLKQAALKDKDRNVID